MNIKVRKTTNVDDLRKRAAYTSGHDCHMTLATAYRNRHSVIRSQFFEIELQDIPLFVASQLVRSHVGIQFYQLSKRPDRGGESFVDVCSDLVEGLQRVEDGQNEDVMEMIYLAKKEFKTLPERFDRYAPTDLFIDCNAESIMNMAAKRLCAKASSETREIVGKICELVEECDPDLYPHLVRPCVACGLCRESKSCGYMVSNEYLAKRKMYKAMFNPQKSIT